MEINYKKFHYELKLKHQVKRQPEAKDFNIDVSAKIFRQESSDPLEEICFSSTVDDFVWEDEDCPEKVALYKSLVDAGIIEAQFLVNDIISYVSHEVLFIEDDYKGVFKLMVEVRLPPEPVELNYAQEAMNKKTREEVLVDQIGWDFKPNSISIPTRKIYSKFETMKRLVGFVTWGEEQPLFRLMFYLFSSSSN